MSSETAALVVAILSIVMTFLAIIIGFMLTKSYNGHIQELAELRRTHEDVSKLLDGANEFNAAALVHSQLSQGVLFNLLMCQRRLERCATQRKDLVDASTWITGVVDDARRETLLANLDREVALITRTARAREQDLYWLLDGPTRTNQHLRALVELHGDDETVRLLARLCELKLPGDVPRQLAAARAALQTRLGHPFTPVSFDSSSWTGLL